MNRFIYSILFYLATPLLIVRLLWRSLRAPAYRKRWSERFALYSSDSAKAKVDVVFHAVSVGEVHAALPLISLLQATKANVNILLTTSTPTGSARVTQLLGDKVSHVYLPYDYPGAIKRFLEKYEPRLMVIMETELWPNLINICAAKRVKLILANARLSDKSLRSYQKVSRLTAEMLQQLDRVTAQSEQDSQRLQTLGMESKNVTVTGNLKYDMDVNTEQLQMARQEKSKMNGRPVLIAASTRAVAGEAEEEKVLAAFRQILDSHPTLLLIIVPRHPERFNEVFEMSVKHGFSTARRSQEKSAKNSHQLLLGDSMGEMHYYFGLADIAFVGGSLVATGCQNIIEPAAFELPVLTGPSLFNFQHVSEQMIEAGGQSVINDEQALAKTVITLLDDNEKTLKMGKAAKSVVDANRGATAKNLELICELLL